MKDDLAEGLRIKHTPTHTLPHPPHTKNKPTISTSTIARVLDGILITIKLTEDVPDQRKAL